ncbi:probable 26S proteasome regulatory subunit 10B [Camellia sinensis]|uniref:probable 26S proteasome regulatory subunit 10B n=1 Tax=Camellia sinensis TaxID=4442 RepID=UPI001036C57D|nr:probable 26S proteasome regulatory subunit 10B [Camellia sinensis]XP_028063923.1 probable 26S proteasome regulatory subunit 10B [Camellia sinensis]
MRMVDSFAVARDNEMHEATRRILSVLLRQIDGFEQEKKVVVIAATSRKQDPDPALISRFDSMITFGLPDQQTRQEIAAQYAKHMAKSDLAAFAKVTEESIKVMMESGCEEVLDFQKKKKIFLNLQGFFGEVFRGIWNGTDVAIKVFLEQDLTVENIENFYKEISVLRFVLIDLFAIVASHISPPPLCSCPCN